LAKKSAVKTQEEGKVALVQQAHGGDEQAFAQLFVDYHPPVLNYVYHMLGDRQAAEDITQDAFIRAHARIGQLGPPWDFKSWVFRIASNLTVDYLRRGRRFVELEEQTMSADSSTTRRPSERDAQRAQEQRAVWLTLDGMPTTYRQALVMREFNGFSYRELSNAMECSYDNARQIVHRARLNFRERHGLRMALARGVERCRELGDMLSAYHDGELSADQMEAVQAHIATCPYCRETEEDLRKVGALIAGFVPILPSAGWVEHVLGEMGIRHVPPPSGSGAEGAAGGGGASGGGMGGAGGGTAGGLKALWTGSSILAKSGFLTGMLAGLTGLTLVAAMFHAGVFTAPPPPPAPVFSPPLPSPTGVAIEASPTMNVQPPPPVASATPSPSPSPSPTPSPTVTPTPTEQAPIVIADANSNCRFGPGTVYNVITYLLEGQSAPIDGRNAEWTWWWIERVDGTGHCWVWDGRVTVQGDTSDVPVIAAPPTPTPEDKEPPSITVSYAPEGSLRPDDSDIVTLVVSAADEHGIARIEIWLAPPGSTQPKRRLVCESTETCTYQGGPYTPGSLIFYGVAVDTMGNTAESNHEVITIYSTVK
jgi:RNA polymerase sigma-70 factor (ECF subfamily)